MHDSAVPLLCCSAASDLAVRQTSSAICIVARSMTASVGLRHSQCNRNVIDIACLLACMLFMC